MNDPQFVGLRRLLASVDDEGDRAAQADSYRDDEDPRHVGEEPGPALFDVQGKDDVYAERMSSLFNVTGGGQLEVNDSWEDGGQNCSELQHLTFLDPEMLGSLLPLGLLCLIVTFGNILVICAVRSSSKLRGSTNMLIVSLAVADLLLGVLVLPLSAIYEVVHIWIFSSELCFIWLSVDVLTSTASILHLVIISLDRYIAVTHPVTYPNIMTSSRTKLMIAGIWVISFVICFPPLIGWDSRDSSGFKDFGDCKPKCMLSSDPGYVIYSAVGSFFAPMLVMIFFNWKIYRTATKTTKAIRQGFTRVKNGGEYIGGMGIHRGKTARHRDSVPPERNYVELRPLTGAGSGGPGRHRHSTTSVLSNASLDPHCQATSALAAIASNAAGIVGKPRSGATSPAGHHQMMILGSGGINKPGSGRNSSLSQLSLQQLDDDNSDSDDNTSSPLPPPGVTALHLLSAASTAAACLQLGNRNRVESSKSSNKLTLDQPTGSGLTRSCNNIANTGKNGPAPAEGQLNSEPTKRRPSSARDTDLRLLSDNEGGRDQEESLRVPRDASGLRNSHSAGTFTCLATIPLDPKPICDQEVALSARRDHAASSQLPQSRRRRSSGAAVSTAHNDGGAAPVSAAVENADSANHSVIKSLPADGILLGYSLPLASAEARRRLWQPEAEPPAAPANCRRRGSSSHQNYGSTAETGPKSEPNGGLNVGSRHQHHHHHQMNGGPHSSADRKTGSPAGNAVSFGNGGPGVVRSMSKGRLVGMTGHQPVLCLEHSRQRMELEQRQRLAGSVDQATQTVNTYIGRRRSEFSKETICDRLKSKFQLPAKKGDDRKFSIRDTCDTPDAALSIHPNVARLKPPEDGNVAKPSFSKRNIKSQVRKFKMETKAAKTIGIIVGCFVVCWLPFFSIYISRPACEDCVPDLLFSIFFWLGYCNSALNPFIYALFARDFRIAFKKILCRMFCKTMNR